VDSAARKYDTTDAEHAELTVTCGHTPTLNVKETIHHIVLAGWHYDCNINIADDK